MYLFVLLWTLSKSLISLGYHTVNEVRAYHGYIKSFLSREEFNELNDRRKTDSSLLAWRL